MVEKNPKKDQEGADNLGIENDSEILKQFVSRKSIHNFNYSAASEEVVVLYSGTVQKWNNWSMNQSRSLVITNLNIYNFKKKSKHSPSC